MKATLLRKLRPLVDYRDAERHFTHDPARMARRVLARPGRAEFFALAMSLGFALMLSTLAAQGPYAPYDYSSYMDGVRGDRHDFYYAEWSVPVFVALDALPLSVGFLLWNAANLIGLYAAARVFGGSVPVVLLSYQTLYLLYYGNIVGIILGALALFWWAIHAGRWEWAGLGLVIAATKYQLGLPLGLALWLLAGVPWRSRWRVLALPVAVALASLILAPSWPLDTLANIRDNPPGDWGSISLWQWIGPLALLLWVPVLALRLSTVHRLILLAAAMAASQVYYQQTDLLALFVLPVGSLGLLGNLGFLYIWYQWDALRLLVVIPLLAYGGVLVTVWRRRRVTPAPAPDSAADSAPV